MLVTVYHIHSKLSNFIDRFVNTVKPSHNLCGTKIVNSSVYLHNSDTGGESAI